MSFSNCPFCQQSVLTAELQRHANSHFEDEEHNNSFTDEQIAMHYALAQAIELSSSTSPQIWVETANSCESQKRKFPESGFTCAESSSFADELYNQLGNDDEKLAWDIDLEQALQVDDAMPCEIPRSSSSQHDGTISGGVNAIEEKISYLMRLQIRETYYHVKDGVIPLLKNCLEVDPENSISILSGYVDHFRSTKSEDFGWGCGWRNIQMMSSHLLKQRQEARKVLFGGSGFVPNIVSLQRWLEIAWEKGFDPVGSNSFDYKIYGKKDWIGTTECATIFRSFGFRARIVDLCSKLSKSKKVVRVYGPMDRFISRGDGITIEASSSGSGKDKYMSNEFVQAKGHQRLMDWVWSYFSDDRLSQSGHNQVILSEKTPLYFQHDGHSRTIVGIQAKRSRKGMKEYNLLILDPCVPMEVLERSLRLKSGWQKFIKRGVHTLKKLEYQLCYIDGGIATGMEMEELKTIDSVYVEF